MLIFSYFLLFFLKCLKTMKSMISITTRIVTIPISSRFFIHPNLLEVNINNQR